MPVINTPTSDIYFETQGQGAPILFIQGVGVIGKGWSPQVQSLSKSFQTITFDNRGIGQSVLKTSNLTIEQMAEDAIAILNHLKIPSAHVVGHSMGGTIAQDLAIRHPDRVKSLSLLCTFYKGSQAAQLNSRIFWLGLKTRIGTRKSRRKAFLEILFSKNYLSTMSSFDNLAQQVGELVGRDLADSPPIIMRQLRATTKHDLSTRLIQLANIPTLVIAATEDPIALPKFTIELAKQIPGAKCHILENAAHGIVLERPEEINQHLFDFIDRSN